MYVNVSSSPNRDNIEICSVLRLIRNSFVILKDEYPRIFKFWQYYLAIGVLTVIIATIFALFSSKKFLIFNYPVIDFIIIFYLYILPSMIITKIIRDPEITAIKAILFPFTNFKFLLVTLVANLAIFGASILIIPAIIMKIWYYFTIYIMVEENEYNFYTIYKSREYIRGNFLKVLFKKAIMLLILSLISFLLLTLSYHYLKSSPNLIIYFFIGIISLILIVFDVTLYTLYDNLLYQEFYNKKDISDALYPSERQKWLFISCALIAGLLIVASLKYKISNQDIYNKITSHNIATNNLNNEHK
jgi:hypothetical protein